MPGSAVFLARHAAIGIAALGVALLVWDEPAGLGRLPAAAREHPLPLPLLLLWLFGGLTSGGARMAAGIMLPSDEWRRPAHGRLVPAQWRW